MALPQGVRERKASTLWNRGSCAKGVFALAQEGPSYQYCIQDVAAQMDLQDRRGNRNLTGMAAWDSSYISTENRC